MPIQEIMDFKASGNEEKNMALLLAVHCAPVIKGSKAANIMTVTRKEFARIDCLLKGTNISHCFLNVGEDKAILYLYRENKLKEYLRSAENRAFLKDYGYNAKSIRDMLDRLSDRICMYSDGKIDFPHEIGIFLGYPLKDVKGFIENEGRNFIYLGYWKVYHDVQGAVRLFERYDEEREKAVKEVVLGKTIREIAV